MNDDALARWYLAHGRHDLPWRATRDRWSVLVSEIMLHQTQVSRVAQHYERFLAEFPTPAVMAAAGPAAVITAWDRLGYPRRARRLWEASAVIAEHGWPDDLTTLPGVGRYTAAAVAAQVDDAEVAAVEVNVRRVLERVRGRRLTDRAAEQAMLEIGKDVDGGRDRLLAIMDVGALVCRAREVACVSCPLQRECVTRGVRADETRSRQSPFAGSFRQRRGRVLASLRVAATPVVQLDAEALASLVRDGLAAIDGPLAHLPHA